MGINREILEELKIRARLLRRHSLVSTAEAGSGHPTSCLSCAEIVAALFFHVMRFDLSDPKSPDNDRFILSKGHAAPVLYAALAEAGALSVEELLTLRRFDSPLEGHPTPRLPWVEAATGSLGQGLSIGVGMALAGKYLDKKSYKVYVLMGDGEVTEGAVWEAAQIAAHYKLDNLIGIIDVNRLGQSQATIFGHDLESYRKRFEAFGWRAVAIDGHDIEQVVRALEDAGQVSGQPNAIVARTVKGKGVSFLEDREGWHGKPLKKGEELERALRELGDIELRSEAPRIWLKPQQQISPARMEITPPDYKIGQEIATREAYGSALVKLGAVSRDLVVLDGDTKNSTYSEKFLKAYPERFFEGFIAEQNMVGTAVGLAARGKLPFASTFACFLTRAFDQIRMAAISRANIKLCGSHAGVSIGEDGPSQMGLEDIAMMRAVADSVVLYPCDAVSAERMVELAANRYGIVYIRTTRPKSPVIYRNDARFAIGGSHVLRASPEDRLTVVAAGITVHEALKAYERLKSSGIMIRVVDAYSVKPMDIDTLRACLAEVGNIFITVEDHYAEGGLGDALLDALAEDQVRVIKLAVRQLPRSGRPAELMHAFEIDSAAIVRKTLEIIGQASIGLSASPLARGETN